MADPGTLPSAHTEALLAKKADGRFQTLLEHTRWALLCLRRILQRPGVQAKAAWLGMGPGDLARSAFLAVAFHDAGKGSRTFQRRLTEGRGARGVPHPLASALVLLRAAGEGAYLWPAWPYPVLEALAVMAHHTELHAAIYRTTVGPDARLDLDVPRLRRVIDGVLPLWTEFGYARWGDPPRLDPNWPEKLHQLGKVRPQALLERLQQMVAQVPERQRPALKATYTLLLAVLEEADQAASRAFEAGTEPERGLLVRDPQSIADAVRQRILTDIAPSPLRPFQLAAEAAGGRPAWGSEGAEALRPASDGADEREPPRGLLPGEQVVLAVPCGRGKTEAALLWWAALAMRGRVDRLVWAMPTQVTSNTLHERLTRLVGSEHVGLYHGNSLLERERRSRPRPLENGQPAHSPAVLQELMTMLDAEDEAPLQTDPEALRNENRLGEWMARLMTVTTVDHLLFAFCHGFGKADYTLGHLQGAAVIFDEVHYYDTHMLANLREAFRLLRTMGVPHLLMSGTLPASLLDQFGIAALGAPSQERSAYLLIEDREGETWRPFHLRTRAQPLLVEPPRNEGPEPRWRLHPEAVDLLEEGRRRGWTQMVVVNTVHRAQDAYLDLVGRWGSEHVGLLHSRFAYQDRRALEEQLLGRLRAKEPGLVVVATQVVEVSLDLSVTRMLSELAPLDALGQRAGRVHRGSCEPGESEFWIWLPADGLPYQRGPLRLDDAPVGRVLERSWQLVPLGAPPLGRWRELCDELYRTRRLGPSNLPELFAECTLFGHRPKTIRFDEASGRVFKPRAILQPTVNVVARVLLDELGGEAYDELWHVPVPQWWVLRDVSERTGHFFIHQYEGRRYLICTLPYRHDLGFYDERTGNAESGAFIDLA